MEDTHNDAECLRGTANTSKNCARERKIMGAASSPLGQLIQSIMHECQEPLSIIELQQRIRRKGHRVDLERLREILRDRTVWTELADEHYILRDMFSAENGPMEEPTTQVIYLPNLPLAQKNYIVLDLETTGFDPNTNQIIQIAALRVEDCRPVAFRAWDIQCAPEDLDPGLRRVLHLDEQRIRAIAAAPPLTSIWGQVRDFIGSAPLVIHNARFDVAFLQAHDPFLANPIVDTLELSLLLLPYADRHTLIALTKTLDINLDSISIDGIAGIPAGHRVATDTLHDAITDVLVLASVYQFLIERWNHTGNNISRIWAGLLPELFPNTNGDTNLLSVLPSDIHTNPGISGAISDASPTELLDRVAADAGLVSRPSQRAMVNTITDALSSDTSRLIEAPTGTGKTIGYLIPAIWTARTKGRRIAIATAYKNLQDQLERDIIRLQTTIPFRAAVLKGTSNYVCLREVQHAVNEAGSADWVHRYILAWLTHWCAEYSDATIDEIPFWLKTTFPQTNTLLREITVDPATCTERRCPFYDQCHLFAARRRAEQADILLINQAVWLSSPTGLPQFDALIIDEAHNLEDMATSALREEVGDHSLRALLTLLHVPGTRRGLLSQLGNHQLPSEIRTLLKTAQISVGQSMRLLHELRSTLAEFVVHCDSTLEPLDGAQLRLAGPPERIYPVAWLKVQQALEQLWDVYLNPLIDALETLASWIVDQDDVLGLKLRAVVENLVNQNILLRSILQALQSNTITWIDIDTSETNAHWALCAAPLSVATALQERYQLVRSVMLTSATLTTGPHDFAFFVERLGLRTLLSSDHAITLPGELPYKDNVILGLPSYLTYTPARITQESFIQEFADELSLLLRFTDGRALVLFTARKRLEAVYNRNASDLEEQGIPIFAQRAGASRQALIEDFRTQGNAGLYGLKSFWEGIDVPGQALSVVVMEKLPYPAFNDPIHAARREAVARQSGREFQDYLFPLMVLQFKQGFGRLLRAPDDHGAVILYDKRVSRKSYLPALLGSLPGYQPRDTSAERSRRAFYSMLGQRLPDIIDLEAKSEFLESLPDILLTDLENLIMRLALPDPLPDDHYDEWRPQILQALQALYGFKTFRSPEQEAAFRAMLTGRDVMAVLPTGAGKSVCFQLPALLRHGTTLICSPLIALMKDQVDKLHEKRIEVAAALMSGQSAAEREEILERLRAGRLRLLYLSPERLRDPVVLAALAAAPIRQVVADEAHCVALWGPSFRPDFLMLPQIYAHMRQRPPIAAFTATATPAITAAITESLEMTMPVLVRSSITRPELRLLILDHRHRYHPVRSKNDQIRHLLLLVQTAVSRDEAMIIYVSTVKEAEYLARLLQVAGIAARAYHGRMDIQERTTISEQFMDDLLSIVVCTKAFGMGIDKPDIRYVVHFNVPGDLESYFQEIGRAGRDGRTAYTVMLYHKSDERIHEFFIEQSRPDGELLSNLWRWIVQQPREWTLHPQSTRDSFDIDELELRRAIYLLEQSRLIRRGADVTIRGSLTLLHDWPTLLDRCPPEEHHALMRLKALLPETAWSSSDLVMEDIAVGLGMTAPILESWLIKGAVRGDWLYRPWEKGYHITRLVSTDTPLPSMDVAAVQNQQAKLGNMHAFVHSRECRWQVLRRYFGENIGAPCGTCDRCDPEQRYPWSGKTGRDVPDVSNFLDLPGTLLSVIWWNEQRLHDGKRPFGRKSIIPIIRGDEYSLMFRRPPGPATDARRHALRTCPYWGVCRTLRRSARELQALLDRLLHEGYIAIGTAVLDEDHSYEYLALTDKGQAQRLSTTRISWENTPAR